MIALTARVVRSSANALMVAVALGAGACASGSVQHASQPQVSDCAGLAGLQLANGGIVESAESIAEGASFPVTDAPVFQLTSQATFCRVNVRLRPVEGSDIRTEIWLPAREDWNGRFLGSGNGGFGGSLAGPIASMFEPVAHGFAAAGTDMGHVASPQEESGRWALGHPERVADHGHRATHLTAVAAKDVITLYYGRAPERSYFHGCSDGGREALMEATRYPGDYDGIIAGEPAFSYSALMTASAWNVLALTRAQVTSADLELLNNAVLAACDELDGVRDRTLDYPDRCAFDPAQLRCRSGGASGCLSDAKVEAIRAILRGPRTSDGEQFWPGLPLSTISGWAQWLATPNTGLYDLSLQYFRYMVHQDETWSFDRFDLDRDLASARAASAEVTDAESTNLRAFFERGGRLFMYTGWNDAAITAPSTIEHYEAIRAAADPEFADHMRLYVTGGFEHCLGGPQPSGLDMLTALDGWMQGTPAPEHLLATDYDNGLFAILGRPARVERTRPMCAWPTRIRWNGIGPGDDAASYTCEAPN